MSCRYPGSVISSVRIPPPIVSACSRTSTERPAWASEIAAARPFGPEPTTTASYPFTLIQVEVQKFFRRRETAPAPGA